MTFSTTKLYSWLAHTEVPGVHLDKVIGFDVVSQGIADIQNPRQLEFNDPPPYEELPKYRYILTIPQGRLIGIAGFVGTPDSCLIESCGLTGLNALAPVQRDLNNPGPITQTLPGTAATIANNGWMNYFHCLIEILPKLQLLKACHYSYDILVTSPLSLPMHEELLQRLQVDLDRVVQLNPDSHLVAERLVVPSQLSNIATCRTILETDVLDWIRSLFPHLRKPQRRLYLSRSTQHFRKIMNEEELLPILKSFDFEIVHFENYSIEEQARMAGEAAIMMGPPGAAFTNMLFASPDAQMIELSNPHFHEDFWGMFSRKAGFAYHRFIGTDHPSSAQLPVNANHTIIPPQELKKLLDRKEYMAMR